VAQGVAEVEDAAPVPFPLIGSHNLSLDGRGPVDDLGQFAFVPEEPEAPRGQARQEVRVPDESGLEDLGQAVEPFGRGQGAQKLGVHGHQPGLVKGAQEGFSLAAG
jgi:hypothetical protein